MSKNRTWMLMIRGIRGIFKRENREWMKEFASRVGCRVTGMRERWQLDKMKERREKWTRKGAERDDFGERNLIPIFCVVYDYYGHKISLPTILLSFSSSLSFSFCSPAIAVLFTHSFRFILNVYNSSFPFRLRFGHHEQQSGQNVLKFKSHTIYVYEKEPQPRRFC